LVVRKDPPPLRARLYPSALTLLSAAFLSAGPALMGDLPVPVVAPSVLLLLAEARRFWHRAPDDAELRRIVLVATGAAALGFVAAATHLRPGRFTTFPATGFAKGALFVLCVHWGRLGPGLRLLLPALFGGWAVATQRAARHTAVEMVIGAVDLAQVALSAWRLSDLVDAEAQNFDDVLQEELTVACQEAARRAVAVELDHHERQLAIARAALEDVRDRLEPAVAELL
jgi:hypothetical protein